MKFVRPFFKETKNTYAVLTRQNGKYVYETYIKKDVPIKDIINLLVVKGLFYEILHEEAQKELEGLK